MLTTPWALLALASIPVVFGIYLFRTRSRRREVSSLFLWVDRSQAKQGGRRIQRLQLPLLILFELLALILLAVAAARPMMRLESLGQPTMIILDASYSMNAGSGDDTAFRRARDGLDRLLDTQVGYPAQFLLAGAKPQLLAGRAKNAAEARDILQHWTCESPTADLDGAISFASNITSADTKFLVVTDRGPTGEIAEGRVLWRAFGKPLNNLAIIHSSRVFQDDRDRLLLEIANLSESPQPLHMTLVEPQMGRVIYTDNQTLEPGQVHLIRTGLREGMGTIEVRLGDDMLALDNRLTILPASRKPVRVQLGSLPGDLAPKIRRAVETSGIADLVTENPDMYIGTETVDIPGVWTVRIITPTTGDDIKSFIGPFIIDHSSTLANGLTLEGVVWSGNETIRMDGTPVISAGDVPLLAELRRRDGTRLLTLQINDRLSTLTSHPSWPILFWNVLRYRAGLTPGIARNNLKLGTEAEFVAADGDKEISVKTPSGKIEKLGVTAGAARIPGDEVGLYQVTASSGRYEFAVGTLSATESNLLDAETVTAGNWFDEETLRTKFESVAWALLLAALACLTLHHWFISTEKSELEALKAK